jgi:hypothetical protein
MYIPTTLEKNEHICEKKMERWKWLQFKNERKRGGRQRTLVETLKRIRDAFDNSSVT